jgi:hypothetical protein
MVMGDQSAAQLHSEIIDQQSPIIDQHFHYRSTVNSTRSTISGASGWVVLRTMPAPSL